MKKRISIFVALFSLMMTLSLIQSTYAKYSTSTSANNALAIARWNIKINDQDVVKSSDFSTTIQPVVNENQYIKEGVIAPTSTGYFDITIDTTDTDVSMDYTISLVDDETNTISDLKIIGYTINGTSFTGDASSIEGSIAYDATERFLRIRINFEWKDTFDEETMDNKDDTNASVEGIAKHKLNVNFVQKH